MPAAGIIARRAGSLTVLAVFAGVVTVEVSVRRLLQLWSAARKGGLRKADPRRVVRHRVVLPRGADDSTTHAADRVKVGRRPRDQVSTVVDLAAADLNVVVSAAVAAVTQVAVALAVLTQVVAAPVPVPAAVVAGSVAADLAAVDPAAVDPAAAEIPVVEAVAAVDQGAAVAASLRT